MECLARKPQLAPLLGMVSDTATAAAVTAERSLLEVLEARCNAPVGAYAAGAGQLRMQAAVISGDGRRVLRAYRAAPADAAWRLGRDLGAELLHRGRRNCPSHSGFRHIHPQTATWGLVALLSRTPPPDTNTNCGSKPPSRPG